MIKILLFSILFLSINASINTKSYKIPETYMLSSIDYDYANEMIVEV